MATATLHAILPRRIHTETLITTGIVALFAMLVSLEGHNRLELAAPIYLGNFAETGFALAEGPRLARVAADRFPQPWMR